MSVLSSCATHVHGDNRPSWTELASAIHRRRTCRVAGLQVAEASCVMVKQRKNGGKPRNGVPWWRKLVLPRRGVKDSRLRPAVDTPEQVVKLEK